MQIKEIKTIKEQWIFYNNKLEYYRKNFNKIFYFKEVKDKKLRYAISLKKEDLEKNLTEIPFYGEDLPPISSGNRDQTFVSEDPIPLEIDVWNRQVIKKVDNSIHHTDSHGGDLVNKSSIWEYEIQFEILDGKSLWYPTGGYDLNEIYKEVENLINLFENKKIVEVKESVPVAIINWEFYHRFAECFFGPEIEENLVWTAYDQEIQIIVKEDPFLRKPYIYFDDDGLKTRKKVVVDNKKINPLYDVYFAFKYNKEPTGNGFYGLLPNGVGYSYLIYDGKEKIKLEEFDKIILGFSFLGWHTCNWKEGRMTVTLDCGVLCESGNTVGVVLNVPLTFDLKEALKNPVLLDEEYMIKNVKFYPLVITCK